MRVAICALAISTLSLARVAHAQEKPWEVALALSAFNTYYEEDFSNKIDGSPQDVRGNSLTAPAFMPRITYRMRQDLRLPFFLSIEAAAPAVTMKRLEVGHLYANSKLLGYGTFTTQQEDVQHSDLSGRATLGWEMLPFFQPYVSIERSSFASRRTGQLDGTDAGTLVPDPSQDYTETVTSTYIGFGFEGVVPLNINTDVRLRYAVGYEIPQTVKVENTSFDPSSVEDGSSTTGQGTTGYTYGGRVQLDMPFSPLRSNDGYWTIGGVISKHQWNGDGQQTRPIGQWPSNFRVEAGGFVGIGMFF